MLGPARRPGQRSGPAHPDQQRFEVDQPDRSGSATIGLGQDEQALGELGEPVALLHRGEERIAGAWTEVTGAQGTVELGLDDRDRRAELMAGVGNEPGLALVGGLHPGEHLVQGDAEAVDLVLGGRQRQPLVGLVQGDGRRAAAHGLDRPQPGPGEQRPDQRRQHQGRRPADGERVHDTPSASSRSRSDSPTIRTWPSSRRRTSSRPARRCRRCRLDDRAVHRRVRDHRAPNGGVPAPAAVIEQGTIGAEELHEALLGVLDRDPTEARAERQLPGGGRPGPEQRVDPVVEVGPEPGIDEP